MLLLHFEPKDMAKPDENPFSVRSTCRLSISNPEGQGEQKSAQLSNHGAQILHHKTEIMKIHDFSNYQKF